MNRANDPQTVSHHQPAGGFRNPWPGGAQQGVRGLFKWMLTRSSRAAPAGSTASLRVAPRGVPPASSDRLRVTWVGHSSFLIQAGGLNMLTDPVWSDRASPVAFAGPKRLVPPAVQFDDLPRIDVTLLSHDHYDHLDDTTVKRLIGRFPAMTWLVPLGVGRFLQSRGARFVTESDWWHTTTLGEARFGCTPAQHFSGRFPWNRNATLWCGWAVRIAGIRVFFAGDTGLHPEFAAIAERFGPFDLSILPIGAYEPRWFMKPVHMSPDEAVRSFRDLLAAHPNQPSVMLASHWGTFRLTDEPVTEPPVLARASWNDAGLAPDDLWIFAHGESRSVG